MAHCVLMISMSPGSSHLFEIHLNFAHSRDIGSFRGETRPLVRCGRLGWPYCHGYRKCTHCLYALRSITSGGLKAPESPLTSTVKHAKRFSRVHIIGAAILVRSNRPTMYSWKELRRSPVTTLGHGTASLAAF